MSRSPSFTPGDVNDLFLGSLGKGRRKRESFMWARNVYKKLVDAYGLDRGLLNAYSDEADDPEKDFRSVLEGIGELEWITAVKTESTLGAILDHPLKSPAFDALLKYDLRDPFEDGGGVVFPMSGKGDWIIHTLGHPDGTLGGRSFIVIYANNTDTKDIVIESLAQFIETRKEGR